MPVDFVISLGGDGTTLWVSTIFPEVVPPVVGITLGSLSYLNQFKTEEILPIIRDIVSSKIFRVQLRSRLCKKPTSHTSDLFGSDVALHDENENELFSSHCVNECVVDRGERN